MEKILKMQGLTLSSIKKNPTLIPIYACLGAGILLSGFYIIRLAVYNPEVSWLNKKEAEPWNVYKDKQYKFSSPVNKGAKSLAPEY